MVEILMACQGKFWISPALGSDFWIKSVVSLFSCHQSCQIHTDASFRRITCLIQNSFSRVATGMVMTESESVLEITLECLPTVD